MWIPPMTSSTLASGYNARISLGLTTLTVKPKTLAIDALRRNSSIRPAVVASEIEPHCR
jgi:hypothetical protein